MDAPLRSSGLSLIYGIPRGGVKQKNKLWSGYKELSGDGFCDFAVSCGVKDRITIDRQDCYLHQKFRDMTEGLGWTRSTRTGTNEDYAIAELDELLGLADLQVNALIWRTLCNAPPEVLEAKYTPNRKYPPRTQKSSLVLQLSSAAWVPDRKGKLREPSEISKDNLHPDFKYDNRNGWLDEIGFGEEKKLADEEFQRDREWERSRGLRTGIVELLRKFSDDEQTEIEELLKQRAAARARAQRLQKDAIPFHKALANSFHANASHEGQLEQETGGGVARNPSRRKEKLGDEISDAIENEPLPETRFTFGLVKKWKGKNDVVRVKLKKWYGGRCQICKQTFTQRNGEPYFEGLYLVPHTRADWVDRPGNVVCLCPLHSAMFQFGPKSVDGNFLDRVVNFVPRGLGGTEDPVLRLNLCGENVVLTFDENHFLELQVMAQKSMKAVGAK
jgi:hypothetical protein